MKNVADDKLRVVVELSFDGLIQGSEEYHEVVERMAWSIAEFDNQFGLTRSAWKKLLKVDVFEAEGIIENQLVLLARQEEVL